MKIGQAKLHKAQRTSGLPFLKTDQDAMQQAIAANFDKVAAHVGWDGHSVPDKAVFERSARLLERTERIIQARYPVEGLVALPRTEKAIRTFVKEHGSLLLTLNPENDEIVVYILDSAV